MQIIEKLVEYYDLQRKAGNIPKVGYTNTRVIGVIIFDTQGKLVDILPLGQGKKAVEMELPVVMSRSSGVKPNFSCDNSKYALGVTYDKVSKSTVATTEYFKAYAEWNKELLFDSKDPYVQAYLKFLDTFVPNPAVLTQYTDSVLSRNGNLVFQLDGADSYVHELDEVVTTWEKCIATPSSDDIVGQCSITGEQEVIARLHNGIKGIRGASSSGAKLVSFNTSAFESYGKVQSVNSSMGTTVAFKYVLALQKLLDESSLVFDGVHIVYWATTTKENKYNDIVGKLFGVNKTVPKKGESDDDYKERRKQVDQKNTALISAVMKHYQSGRELATLPELAGFDECKMYLLGLTASQARASVRFFKETTFYELVEKLVQHHKDLSLYSNFEARAMTIREMVRLTSPPTKKELPPALYRELSEAVLNGSKYPASLYAGAVARFKVDTQGNHGKAAIIKACLIRQAEFSKNTKLREEITYMLNTESLNTGYRLGRAFAVLEKLQKDAVSNIKTTIRSTHFSSASTTPSIVFPYLLRNANHHIKKANSGGYLHKVLSEILDPVSEFPTNLSMEDQGKFILGYYQQNTDLYRSMEDKEGTENE